MILKYVIAIVSLIGLVAADALTNNGVITEDDKQVLLDLHNTHRSNTALGNTKGHPKATDMTKLVWDETIAEGAASYASRCIFAHDDSGYGENLYAGASSDDNIDNIGKLESGIESWFNEYKDYTYDTKTCKANEMCGHYTQVVWAKSTRVGCGYATCRGQIFSNPNYWYEVYLVCRYDPPGNFNNQFPYAETNNAGQIASECPSGYTADSSSGLCVSGNSDPTPAPVQTPPEPTPAPVIAPPEPTSAPVLAPPEPTPAPIRPTSAPVLAPSEPTSAPDQPTRPSRNPNRPTNPNRPSRPTTPAPVLAPSEPTSAPVLAPPEPTSAPVLAPPEPTSAPVLAPPEPTSAPVLVTAQPTPAPITDESACKVDSPLKFMLGKKKKKKCDWATNQKRCNRRGITNMCAKSCESTGPCVDSLLRFKVKKLKRYQTCPKVAQRPKLCCRRGVTKTCPVACKDSVC